MRLPLQKQEPTYFDVHRTPPQVLEPIYFDWKDGPEEPNAKGQGRSILMESLSRSLLMESNVPEIAATEARAALFESEALGPEDAAIESRADLIGLEAMARVDLC